MLNLFIVLKGLLSPKIALPEFSGLFYFKTKADKRKLPDWVCRRSRIGHSPAFSLVEMLMALLVASLLLAALAPVMTKKLGNENINVSGTGGMIPSAFCAFVNDTTEEMIIGNEDKEACVVPENVYSAGAIIASGGGGGGGAVGMAKSSTSHTLITTVNTTNNDLREEKKFDKYTRDIIVKITGAGGGGGGGNFNSTGSFKPVKQADCEPFGIYITPEQNGTKYGICVSKYNPGENRDGSPDIPASVTKVPVGTRCSGGNCCWYGQTAAAGKCNAAGGDYSGCSRTMCQSKAANTVCANWKPLGENGPSGRVPKRAEYISWAPYLKYNSMIPNSTGPLNKLLQLCDNYSTYGATWCEASHNTCMGSYGGSCNSTTNVWPDMCHPRSIHLGDVVPNNTSCSYAAVLDSGNATAPGAYNGLDAYSVRCAVDKTYTFNSFTGGGGGSGVFAHVKVPDSVAVRATQYGDGIIKTYAGAGGKGGEKENTAKGSNGSRSFVEILDSNNSRIWSLRVSGGVGGNGASKTAGGVGGSKVDAVCDYFDITNEKYKTEQTIACNKIPGIISQSDGLQGEDGDSDNPNEAGYGGSGFWSGTASNKTAVGTSGILPGAGGGGGTCVEGSDMDDYVCNDGGNGSGGAIDVSYKIAYPGAGGGGGSAGTVLHIKSFQVRPGDVIKAKIGEGGRGGIPAVNGSDGGNSYIELANGTKYEVEGGGGGLAGIIGNPDSIPSIQPTLGLPGNASKIASGTKNKLSSRDEYFPEKSEETIGTPAVETEDMITSAGGNGGVNFKISTLAKPEEGTPCGGKSKVSVEFKNNAGETIEWQCNNSNIIPLPLSRILSTAVFDSNIMNNFAPGSTGGGGGAWDEDNADSGISSGANGMGGYIYIYFGDWNKE